MQLVSLQRAAWLLILMLFTAARSVPAAGVDSQPACRLPLLGDDAAWQRLPNVEAEIPDRRLPIWAQAFAGPLPRTTAAMLELDYIYRTSEALNPRLRATMRWVAARANQCAYSRKYAEADLLRTGMSSDEVARLESSLAKLSQNEQAAVQFAEKLTVAASSVTDEEVAKLIAAFGEQPVVAMVLQMAYANFQDRLLLALNVDVEPDGPLPPLAVRFVPAATGESIAVERLEQILNSQVASSPIKLGPEWSSVPLEQLLRGMEQQRVRSGRVSVPEWKDVHPRLPPGMYPPDRPVRIKWSLVVLGHQPEMGSAWLRCLRTFSREANQDRVFEETLFWVITRTIDCYY